MTSTFDSGRSPISMVSFLSWECSDQAESDMSSREELQKRQQRPAPNAFPSSCTSPVSTCQSACFPALLAPNRDREIGGGRATRQPGQVRKEAALTRSGSGRSSVSYLFFRRIAQGAATDFASFPQSRLREIIHCGLTDERCWRAPDPSRSLD